MFERVDIALNEQQIRATLNRQESAPWNVNAMGCHVNTQSAPTWTGWTGGIDVPPLKCLMAAPAAVSSCGPRRLLQSQEPIPACGYDLTWMTALPSSVSLGLMIISKSIPSCSMTRFNAIHSRSGRFVRIWGGEGTHP